MTLRPDDDQPEEPDRVDRVSSGDLAYPSDLTDLATLPVCYQASLRRRRSANRLCQVATGRWEG
jgi:hypothetical protein